MDDLFKKLMTNEQIPENATYFDAEILSRVANQSTQLVDALKKYNDAIFLSNYFKNHDIDAYSFEILFRYNEILEMLNVEIPNIETLDHDLYATDRFNQDLESKLSKLKEYVDVQYTKLFELINQVNMLIPPVNKPVILGNSSPDQVLTIIRSVVECNFRTIKSDNTFLSENTNILDSYISRVRDFMYKIKK